MSLIPTLNAKTMRKPYDMVDGATGFNLKLLSKMFVAQCNLK